MNKEDALRDMYNHDQKVGTVFLIAFLLYAFGCLALSMGSITIAVILLLFGLLMVGVAHGAVQDGYVRSAFQRLPFAFNGVSLKAKQNALEQYRITDESDLEDIE